MNQISDILHDQSLPAIALLQQNFSAGAKDLMIGLSTLFDPRYVFLIYAPIFFAINKAVGHRMLIALTLTEWINQILKWMLAGERPYWYVHERNLASATAFNSSLNLRTNNYQQFQVLEQFPVTCELGAGSPSGHAMVTATVWYVLIDAFLKNELPIFGRLQAKKSKLFTENSKILEAVKTFCWSIYALILVAISLSRVYLACHFPHQCICGAILGIVVARFVTNKLQMEQLGQKYFAAFTVFMFCTALGTYSILKSNGFNPLWTVEKATKWCVKKEYLHMDTTPFFSMMRYLGFCLGAGLAFNSKKLAEKKDSIRKSKVTGVALIAQRILTAYLAIYFGRLMLSIPLPNKNLQAFYASSFFVYVVFSYSIAEPIPKLAKFITKNTLSTIADIKQSFKKKVY